MFGFGKKIINEDQLTLYCSNLTGKEIKKDFLSSPFVRRNKKREQKHNDFWGDSMSGFSSRLECYDLVLNYDGHDPMDSFENDNELIVLEWTYHDDGLPSDLPPKGGLQVRGDKWEMPVKIALNNIEQASVWDSFESDDPLSSSDIEMACEVAKWMVAKGLKGGAGIAYKLVTRKAYQPIPRSAKPSLTDLFDNLNNI